MTHGQIYDEPSDVRAIDGLVVVAGPDGVDVTLTPEAAVETSQRLLEQGMMAAAQRRLARSRDSWMDQETDTRPPLRRFDDQTLLDMYDHAHETSDAHCDAIAAELNWRGITVEPCKQIHPPTGGKTG